MNKFELIVMLRMVVVVLVMTMVIVCDGSGGCGQEGKRMGLMNAKNSWQLCRYYIFVFNSIPLKPICCPILYISTTVYVPYEL